MKRGSESARPWSYEEALRSLEAALRFGTNPSLESIGAMCHALGDPQSRYTSVQVTGTNGKSSTARFLEALLRAEGQHTALYTSPELERYPERMEIGGQVVSDADFALAVGVAVDTACAVAGASGTTEPATEFELLTAAALWLFSAREVEIAVLEVGMGGRWDATSVVEPAVAVITGVGLDHMAILGDTIDKIASEKGAIIRPGSIAVLGPGTEPVDRLLLDRAAEVGARVMVVRDTDRPSPLAPESTVRYRTDARPAAPGGTLRVTVEGLLGRYEDLELRAPSYQAPNLATAIAAAEAVLGRALELDVARAAIAACRLPGRFEVMRAEPPVVIDAAHNPQGAAVLAGAIEDAWPDSEGRPTLLLGVLSDKDAVGIVRALAPSVAEIAVTASKSPRALEPDALAALVARETGRKPRTFATVGDGVAALAEASRHGLVVSGSITVAGEAYSALK